MSVMVSKQRQLLCDGCGAAFVVNDGWVSTVKLRKDAQRAGWRRSGGRDRCPECRVAAIKRTLEKRAAGKDLQKT